MRLTALFLLALSTPAYALDTDLGFAASARTTKLAGAFEAQGGLSQVIWGSAGPEPLFGYVRASAAIRTSGMANGYRAQLELYPISIFGITLGRQALSRLSDAPGIDCTRIDCGVDVTSNYLQLRSVFKVREIFGQVTFQRDIFEKQYYSKPTVFDPINQIGIDAQGDFGTTWNAVTGYEIDPAWSSGVVYMHSNADITGHNSQSELIFVRWKPENTTYGIAFGRVQTSVIGVGAQFAFTLSWWPKARIGF